MDVFIQKWFRFLVVTCVGMTRIFGPYQSQALYMSLDELMFLTSVY
jgi:hypothetical protein